MKSLVKFPAYRLYEKSRIEMNDAIMANLVSLQLTQHSLKPVDDDTLMLPDIFPTVKHIKRLHLSVNSVNRLLTNAGSHLSTMAIPYILALHEDYVMANLQLLRQAGLISGRTIRSVRSERMHEEFEAATNSTIPVDMLEQFHLLRLIRNSLIHTGGVPSADLEHISQTISQVGGRNWKKVTGKRPDELIVANEITKLDYGETLICLAITKNIAMELNIALQLALSKSIWCSILQEDFINNHTKIEGLKLRTRKVSMYATIYYKPLGLSKGDLEQIARQIP
jgi:hypothetical protein